jgi:hypothetical protein
MKRCPQRRMDIGSQAMQGCEAGAERLLAQVIF